MRPNGTQPKQISHLTEPDQNLAFARYSPDGRHLVADFVDDSTDWLVTMNLDGSGFTKVVELGDARQPGARRLGGVVMTRRIPTLLAFAATCPLTVLLLSPAAAADSIDGQLVVDHETARSTPLTQLGTDVTKVTHVPDGRFAIAPRWSPDGRASRS